MIPLLDNVFVTELRATPKRTAAELGVMLGVSSNPKIKLAKVLAVGPDVSSVEVDDVVVLDWHGAYPLITKEGEQAIIKETFILAKVPL